MISTRYFRNIFEYIFVFILIFAVASPGLFAQEESSGEEIPVPLIISDEYTGEVLMKEEFGERLFSFDGILEFTGELLNAESYRCLVKAGESHQWLSADNLGKCGIIAEFREDSLDLAVVIPPEARKEQNLLIRGADRELAGVRIEPSFISGTLNSRAFLKYEYESNIFSIEEELDAGLNISSWVVESGITVSNSDVPFNLDYARLVKDIPFISCRAEAGDLTYSISGIDGISSFTGMSFVRNFRIRPDIKRTPVGKESVFLYEDSIVEVEVNGRIIKTLELNAGLYHLEDFGLSEGVNRIRILITSGEETKEEVLLIPMASNLLGEKEIDFGIAAGIPDRQLELPVISSYQRAGISDSLTFGLKEIFPLSTGQMYMEFNGTGATVIGNFFLKAGLSAIPELSTDLILSGKYNYHNILKPSLGSFGGVFRYDLVIQDADNADTGDSVFSASLHYSKPFSSGFNITPSMVYTSGTDMERKFRGNVLFRKSLAGSSAISFDFGGIWTREEGIAFSGTVSFNTVFPDSNQSLMIQQDIDEQKFYLNWNRFPENSLGVDLKSSAQVPFDTAERNIYGVGAGYTFPYGTADFDHRTTLIPDSTDEMTNISRFSLTNGFAFAGNKFGFSRTLRDSFVIVEALGPLKENGVRINPAGSSEKGIAGKNSFVVSPVSSYQPYRVTLEAGELPPGVDLTETQYVFNPVYRSGTLISAGASSNVYVRGSLTGRDGEPVEYGFGFIAPYFGNDRDMQVIEKKEFFTDENGVFEIYNLRPGDWLMTLENMMMGNFRFVIPDDVYGLYEIGELTEEAP